MDSQPAAVYPGSSARKNARAYNEVAFRHLLAADRRRAARTTRSLFLVLIGIRRSPGRCARLTNEAATIVFAGLSACVREIDLVGWYREGYVAAAVLPQANEPSKTTAQLITDRITRRLASQLSERHARKLRVRVVRLGSTFPTSIERFR